MTPLEATYGPEISRWQKQLEQLQRENVELKTKVAEIIKEGIDSIHLERMENFLTGFINKDAFLALLRYDVAAQLRFVREAPEDVSIDVLEKKQSKLSRDISKMAEEFQKLKQDFYAYIRNLTSSNL